MQPNITANKTITAEKGKILREKKTILLFLQFFFKLTPSLFDMMDEEEKMSLSLVGLHHSTFYARK